MTDSDSTLRREELYDLHGVHLDAYDAIVRPDQVLPIRTYTLRRWTPILGATGFWLLLSLQQLSYRNPKGRNWCTVSREVLANDASLSEASVHRYLHADEYTSHGLEHWVCLPSIDKIHQRRRWSSRAGRMTQAINRYTVVMDAPLAPVDQRGLAQFLREQDNIELALESLTVLPLADLLSLMDDCATRFQALDKWDTHAFYPTVADVVQAIGVSLPDTKKERTQFLSLCSRVQQAFVGQVYLGTQYFRRQWVPILGHKLALVVTQLRSHCFWNEDTLRDEVSIGTKDLAKASGCSSGWLRRTYKDDLAQHFFVVAKQGRGKQPQFQVVLREPLAPQDKAEYQALLNAGEMDPENGQLGLPELSPTLANGTGERLGTEQTDLVNVSESTNGPSERLGTEQTNLVNASGSANGPGERLGTEQTDLVNASESANGPGERLGIEQTDLVNASEPANGPSEQHVNTKRNTICINTLFFLSLKQQKHARDSATAALLEEFEIGSPSNSQILSLGPDPDDVRAWMLYALTQPGLRDGAETGPGYVVNSAGRGYVVNRIKKGETPPDRFRRWAKLAPDEWRSLWRACHYIGSDLQALSPSLTTDLDAWHDDFASVFPKGPFGDENAEQLTLLPLVPPVMEAPVTTMPPLDDDPVLAQVTQWYLAEINHRITPMVADDLREQTSEQRNIDVWEYAFWKSRSANGIRRWNYTTAVIHNPDMARVTAWLKSGKKADQVPQSHRRTSGNNGGNQGGTISRKPSIDPANDYTPEEIKIRRERMREHSKRRQEERAQAERRSK
ncbi:MAG: hypothetical protein GY832_24980 [Chloroflexi bacterium]|nr:hypothetical protein [Chloroflexota bacterium]